jgi:paraquat-inducible protein B
VSTGSLDTVILGGVAFGVPEGKQPGANVENGAEFRLYESQEATERNPFEYGANFVVRFKQSLRGLKPGAPVEYRGIPIGRVERIMLKELTANAVEGGGAAIPVLIYVEPGRMELGDTQEALDALKGSIIKGVPNGMRASLATGNLLTGALFIVIDFYEDAEVAEIGEYVGYPTIPTTGGGFARIERQLSAVLEKITALPLEGAVDSATKTLDELTVTLASLQGILDEDATKTLPAEMNAALADLRRTIQGLSPDSPLYQSLDASMYELNRTLENLRAVTKTLSEQPNAAVLPVVLPADPIPEARSR